MSFYSPWRAFAASMALYHSSPLNIVVRHIPLMTYRLTKNGGDNVIKTVTRMTWLRGCRPCQWTSTAVEVAEARIDWRSATKRCQCCCCCDDGTCWAQVGSWHLTDVGRSDVGDAALHPGTLTWDCMQPNPASLAGPYRYPVLYNPFFPKILHTFINGYYLFISIYPLIRNNILISIDNGILFRDGSWGLKEVGHKYFPPYIITYWPLLLMISYYHLITDMIHSIYYIVWENPLIYTYVV